MFATLLEQEMEFFDESTNTAGSLTMKLTRDADAIQGASGSMLGSVVQVRAGAQSTPSHCHRRRPPVIFF